MTYNPDKYKRRYEKKRQVRAERVQFVREQKEGKACADCGRHFPAVCMDFHHINPADKSQQISAMAGHCRSIQSIKEEIAKCVLLCACCHRIRHA